jgi:FAD:protein FMN transferase
MAGAAVVSEERFRVMGSDAHVMVLGDDWLIDLAQARLDYLERIWSRFLATSDVSMANADAGRWTPVSPETIDLVDHALLARRATDGLYDPTQLREVIDAGYVRSFEELGDAPTSRPAGDPAAGAPDQPPSEAERVVEIDRDGSQLRVAVGCGFDPGGIGKGFAADVVVGELLAAGAEGALVNLGGDLRVEGRGPADGDWIVAVEDPRRPDGPPVAELVLARGAVATSSRVRRTWTAPDGAPAHHLIDPRTGHPAVTDVLTATVVASEGWQAEALAKAAFLSGPDHFAERLGAVGATGLLVTTAEVVEAPGLDAFRRTVPTDA